MVLDRRAHRGEGPHLCPNPLSATRKIYSHLAHRPFIELKKSMPAFVHGQQRVPFGRRAGIP